MKPRPAVPTYHLSGARADHFFSALVHARSGRGRWLVRAGEADRGDAAAVRARRAIPDGHELWLCRTDPGRAPFQHLHTDRSVRENCRQIPEGSPARTFGVRYRARLPAPGETLLRARRSRLQCLASARGIFGMAVCNDRRWPETYRVMGLQGVEMVLIGYNTPSVNSQQSERGPRGACSTIACRRRPAPTKIRPEWCAWPRPVSRMASP